LSSWVNDVFVKLVSKRLDGDEVFGCCKYLLKEKNDLVGEVERSAEEKETLNATMAESAKLIVHLQAQLRDLKLTASSL